MHGVPDDLTKGALGSALRKMDTSAYSFTGDFSS